MVSGDINQSPVDLEIGQLMPDDPSYNFHGVIDEIRIYDFALTPDSMRQESGFITTSLDGVAEQVSTIHIFPVPAGNELTIDFTGHEDRSKRVSWKICILDIRGTELLSSHAEDPSTITIDLSSLNAGVYWLRLLQGEKSVIKEFIKY
jgi:hypothetical protein